MEQKNARTFRGGLSHFKMNKLITDIVIRFRYRYDKIVVGVGMGLWKRNFDVFIINIQLVNNL